MDLRYLGKEELEKLVIGAKILGTGGGGSEKIAKLMIEKIFQEKSSVPLISLDDVPSNEYFAIVGIVGGGITEEEKKEAEGLEIKIDEPMTVAVKKLEQYLRYTGKTEKGLYGFFATEIGPENVIIPFYCAAKMDKVVIDGDACGRSKPEISISTTHVAGLPITPLSVVSKFEDILMLENAVDDYRAEKIVRKLSVLAGGEIACCRCPTTGEKLKNNALVRNTISKAIELGDFVLKNRDKKNELSEKIAQIIDGKVIFKGTAKKFVRINKGGFVWGYIDFEGRKGTQFENRCVRVEYKNEYISVIENDTVTAAVPDSIIIVDELTGDGLTPWENDFEDKKRQIAIIHKLADRIWLTERGREIFNLDKLKENFPI